MSISNDKKRDALFAFVVKTIGDNNLLGLPEAEVQSMASILTKQSNSRKEIFEWCNTLMIPENIAVQIVRDREAMGDRFPDSLGATKQPQQPIRQQTQAAVSKSESANSVNTTTTAKKNEPSASSSGAGTSMSGKAKDYNDKAAAAAAAGASGKQQPTVFPELGSAYKGALRGDGELSAAAAAMVDTSRIAVTSDNNRRGGGKKKASGKKGSKINLNTGKGSDLLEGADSGGGIVQGATFECGCYATTHAFLSNCLNCGRIFCKQESDKESCYACGNDPRRCIAYELKVLDGKVDEATKARNASGLSDAVTKRDMLLSYARERQKRTLIIDDQSGVFVEKGAWGLSRAERQTAEKSEAAKRVEEMHKNTGAYSVHLDIVKQSVALGATSIPSEKKEEEEKEVTEDAVQDDDDDDGGNSSAVSDDEEEEEEEEVRVLPMPSLLKRIWFSPDGSNVEQQQQQKKKKSNESQEEQRGGDDAGNKKTSSLAPRQGVMKGAVQRNVLSSRRVQNEYYDEDEIAWRASQEETSSSSATKTTQQVQRGGFIHCGDDDDELHLDPNRLLMSKKKMKRGQSQGDLVEDDDDDDGRSAAQLDADEATRLQRIVESQLNSSSAAADSNTLLKTKDYETVPASMLCSSSSLGGDDPGMCMSMHQPWATLLIAGIKKHEGRTWYSEYRGKLWIHAAAAKPTSNAIEDVEAHYIPFVSETGKKFPTHYPTSCLLGYVYVLDCLSAAEYREAFPDAKNRPEDAEEGTYKFICAGFTALPFPLQMDGKHKIYKLERKVLKAAQKQLQ